MEKITTSRLVSALERDESPRRKIALHHSHTRVSANSLSQQQQTKRCEDTFEASDEERTKH